MITTAVSDCTSNHVNYTDSTKYCSISRGDSTGDIISITTTGTSPIWYTNTTTTNRYTISSPPITIQDALNRIEKRRYHCIYCGTEYIEEKEGFIPNCKNCGAILRHKEND